MKVWSFSAVTTACSTVTSGSMPLAWIDLPDGV
jgi:hypothetical protein